MTSAIVTPSSRPTAAEFMAGPGAGTPLAWLEGLLVALGSHRQGRKWQCPAHGLTGDHSVALAVNATDAGRVLLWCHGGCTWLDVLRALHLTTDALRTTPPATPQAHAAAFLPGATFPPARSAAGGSLADRGFRYESEHPYGHPRPWAWKVRYRHTSGTKEIRWESLNDTDAALELTAQQRRARAVLGLLGRREADMPLYRIGEIRMAAAADEEVLLVESESSVDALTKAGWYATCWAGGAGSCPTEQLRRELADARVVLIPDHDVAGLDVAERICRALPAARVVLGDPGEDARDLLARLGPDAFRAAVKEALSCARAHAHTQG